MKLKFKRNGEVVDRYKWTMLEPFQDGGSVYLDIEGDEARVEDGKLYVTMRFTLPKNLNAIYVKKKPDVKYDCDKILFRETPTNPENKICVDASGQYIFVFGGYGGDCNLGIPCKMLYDVQRDALITKETSISGTRDRGYYLAAPDEMTKFMAALEAYGIQWCEFTGGEFKHVGWFPKDGQEYWYIDRDDKDPFKFKVKKALYEDTHMKKPDTPEFRWNRFETPEDAGKAASNLLKKLQAEITEMIGDRKWT